MMSFEWQTEEDARWEQSDAPSAGGPRRTRWVWLLLFTALLGAGLYFGWRQVQERVDTTTEALRDEVRASYTLAKRAAQDRDQELFVSLLSGRSATWTEAQKRRLDDGLLFSETGRIFSFASAGDPGQTNVTFDPELAEAVLTLAQPLTVDAGSGLTETVNFTQTHVFRQGSQRWLLSPPDDPFWGDYLLTEGQSLHVEYAQRDEILVRRLAADLDRKVMEMCRSLVDCPQDFTIRLRLETDPQSILQAAEGEARLTAGRDLVLPTPTLVGLPSDEAAYAALFRGYARHVISAAIARSLDYTCCEQVRFQEALLDWQLSRLGLRSAPLTAADYLYIIDAPLDVERYWSESEPLEPDHEAPLEIHAFIDFLRGKLSMRRDPLRELQHSLSQRSSFWSWVSSATEYEPTDPTVLREDFTEFVWEKAREAQALAQPLPPDMQPQQDIIAVCGDQTLDIHRYSLSSSQWTREIATGVEFAALAVLPGGNGYLMTGQYPDQEFDTGLVTYLKRGDDPPFTISQSGGVIFPWNLIEPGGERMVVWLLSGSGGSGELPATALMDPATCSPDDCPFQKLPGMPIWSPAGRLGLVLDITDGEMLYLPENRTSWQTLDAQAEIPPVWLDEETIGYVSQGTRGNDHTLWAMALTSGETRVLTTGDDLADAAGPRHRGEPFHMRLLRRHPYRDDTLVILATSTSAPSQSMLFALSQVTEGSSLSDSMPGLTILETFEGTVEGDFFGHMALQSQRYLLLALADDGGRDSARIIIYDLQTQEIALSSVGIFGDGLLNAEGRWSIDGRWLARSLPQAIDLVAPSLQREGRAVRQLVFHDFEECMLANWVNR